jgi:hypothetical protein
MMGTKVAAALAATGWGLALADNVGLINLDDKQSNFCLAAAITLTAWAMMCKRRRPLGAAYDLGYENGRRDAMVQNNGPDGGKLMGLHRKIIEPLCDRVGT